MPPMRILCAPDSFKGTISSTNAARAIAEGCRRGSPLIHVDECPIGDGGEGTLDVLIGAIGGRIHSARVTGPLATPVQARFGASRDGRLGIVEMAEASGLTLVPPSERNPCRTTSFGTGELIRLAINQGCEDIIVALGGSATVDGGAAIAQALNADFFNARSRRIKHPLSGGALQEIRRIEACRLPIRLQAACDVNNPLCGPNGAAAVYGPQKGATLEQVRLLDSNLAHWAALAGGDPNQPGAGAAGGAAYGLASLCHATLERGIDLVLDAVRFDDRCREARIVITGEGRFDAQTFQGKACAEVAKRAAALGVPTIAIVGAVGQDDQAPPAAQLAERFTRVIDLSALVGRTRAMSAPAEVLEQVCAERAGDFIKLALDDLK